MLKNTDKTDLKTDRTDKKSVKSVKKSDESALLKSQLIRALADYDNLRKRVEAEKLGWEEEGAAKAVSKLLPVLDLIEDAQTHLKDSGLAIVIGEFRRSLNELGVEEILVKSGDDFNPVEQEATEIVAGGKEHTISEVVRSGWKIRNQAYIIRPARVKVFGNK